MVRLMWVVNTGDGDVGYIPRQSMRSGGYPDCFEIVVVKVYPVFEWHVGADIDGNAPTFLFRTIFPDKMISINIEEVRIMSVV